ncbi:hypothetical protein AB1L88_22740 [Tautonia sp. JC769]|uniref:hypothetical protein n=1 Tax=Tautonia sp. JC769 TaxID=3232135 RepID=UPI00345A4810
MKRVLVCLIVAGLVPLALASQPLPQEQEAGQAETSSPAKAGDRVTITTANRTISGKARASRIPGWILVEDSATGRELWVPIQAIQSLAVGEAEEEAPGAVVDEDLAPGAARKKYVVYVHGICHHDSGYSNGWWRAMKPFAPDIPDANRREVLWSDLVNLAPGAVDAEAELSEDEQAEQAEVEQQLLDTLRDRAERQQVEAPGGSVFEGEEDAPGGLIDNIPGVRCVDDFTRYMLEMPLRQQIVGRFIAVVAPLLQEEGVEVIVISHSWGTVVALDGLRQLSTQPTPSRVSNLFTVGSALSIGEVRRRRYPGEDFIERPSNVGRWVNLNARNDVVGGPLRQRYRVDFEYLDLPPIGCGSFFPTPSCSHSSYFEGSNVAVNRDIFGRFIGMRP